MKNMLRNKFLLICVLLFLSSVSSAQTDYFSPKSILRFADHLYEQKDFSRAAAEYLRFQYLNSEFSDSINFKLADCYAKLERFDDSNKYLKEISINSDNQFSRQKSKYQIMKNKFLQEKYTQIIEAPFPTDDDAYHDDLIFLQTYSMIKLQKWNSAISFLNSRNITNSENSETFVYLQDYCQTGTNLKTKSPFLAGTLSALLPGMGKVYTKRSKDALTSFVTTGVFSYLAYHNYQEDGAESLRFNIYAALSAVFYLSNIYGSVISAKHYNHDLITDYLHKLEIKLQ